MVVLDAQEERDGGERDVEQDELPHLRRELGDDLEVRVHRLRKEARDVEVATLEALAHVCGARGLFGEGPLGAQHRQQLLPHRVQLAQHEGLGRVAWRLPSLEPLVRLQPLELSREAARAEAGSAEVQRAEVERAEVSEEEQGGESVSDQGGGKRARARRVRSLCVRACRVRASRVRVSRVRASRVRAWCAAAAHQIHRKLK